MRRRRNLQKNYDGFEFVNCENPDNIDDAMERLFKLHEKKWTAVKHKGNFCQERCQGFFTKRLPGHF